MPISHRKILKIYQLLGAVSLLFFGSLIYILYRPTTLIMFHWADGLAINNHVAVARSFAQIHTHHLSEWVVFSLPFGLWVMSYQFFIASIWSCSSQPAYRYWVFVVPVCAVLSELGQALSLVPGRFDIVDLTVLFFCVFSNTYTLSIMNQPGVRYVQQST